MSKYPFKTICVCVDKEKSVWEVRGQDGSLPVTLHSGTEQECRNWQAENCTGEKY